MIIYVTSSIQNREYVDKVSAFLQKHNQKVYKCSGILERNKDLMEQSNVVLVVVPCGIWSHYEMGYARGINKCIIIYDAGNENNTFLYEFADLVTNSIYEVIYVLLKWEKEDHERNSGI